MEFTSPALEPIKLGNREIGLAFLLLAVLVAFAFACWEGVGYICDSVFSVAAR